MDNAVGGSDLGIYVHWPYCSRICPYCDFNVYKASHTRDDLVDAIIADLQMQGSRVGRRTLRSLHFGGGTPSLMAPADMSRIIETAIQLFSPQQDMEIGLEANPNDMSATNLRDWQAVGINRLSVGVQSFEDAALRRLGRDHNGQEAQSALERAYATILRTSCDLIFGQTGQSLAGWRHDLDTAIASGVGHISAYQLTIKPGTAFARAQNRGQDKAVDDDESADFYTCAQETLSGHGYTQYEVSNFAKTLADRSRHNLLYWHGVDYLGLGPGAHGRLSIDGQRYASIRPMHPKDYIAEVQSADSQNGEQDQLSRTEIAQEYVLMGLRCTDGISLRHLAQICDNQINPDVLAAHVRDGYLARNGDRITPTSKGFALLDTLTLSLLS